MNTSINTTHDILDCKVCLEEIPHGLVEAEEVHEYVAYFCGLECYAKWQAVGESTTQNSNTKV